MHRRTCISRLLIVVLVVGCGYPEVSPVAYELSMSLYNISNRELEDQLASIDKRIAEAKSNEEISKNEAKWLDDIVSLAENQQWKKAMKSARRIMEDQVKH